MPEHILKNLSRLVHQLQRERGCISLYSGSLGKMFAAETNKQFLKTDKEIILLNKKYISLFAQKNISTINLEKIEACLQYLSELQENRKNILNLTFPTSELTHYYTYKAVSPLLDIMIKIALFNKQNDPTKVTAYTNLLYWKERTGRGRALGMKGFLTHNFSNETFIEKIKSLILEQESYKRTFLALVDIQIKEKIETILNQSALLRIEKLHKIIESKPDSKLLNSMTPEAWYELITNKIDILHDIELELLDSLSASKDIPKETTQITPPKRGLTSLNNKQREFIKSLPFFLGISDEKLLDILRNAQTKEYRKGQLLFLEGEQATRLYIVLNGWVKLYKGTLAGEETILQMISSGNIIGESPIFLNSAHPVSAQIAENATLLAIPAPIIREQIRSSADLAMNMITSMSHHSQSMIHHIEVSRLKSVTERVGWFLLKLLIERDWKIDAVELPYDKSMIASYLDMKPETFSRTLKHFKKMNFKIEKDTIILPDMKALCGFCDIDIALSCKQHDTSKCSNPIEIDK